jgi:uncharacterized protein (DUF486 family)
MSDTLGCTRAGSSSFMPMPILKLLIAYFDLLVYTADALVVFAGLATWGAFICYGLVLSAERIIHRDYAPCISIIHDTIPQ